MIKFDILISRVETNLMHIIYFTNLKDNIMELNK